MRGNTGHPVLPCSSEAKYVGKQIKQVMGAASELVHHPIDPAESFEYTPRQRHTEDRYRDFVEFHGGRLRSWTLLPPPPRVLVDGESSMVIGTRPVRTVDEFKAAVDALPSGALLYWDSGCFGHRVLPLTGPRMTMEQARKYCENHGAVFRHIVSGY